MLLSFVLGCSWAQHFRLLWRHGRSDHPACDRVYDLGADDSVSDGADAAVPPNWSPVSLLCHYDYSLDYCGRAGASGAGQAVGIARNDFVVAAKPAGAGDMQIIVEHLLPGFTAISSST
ncbi:MAG: hypothetical protein R3E79_53975 [Caldilineaceae bacterium]